MSITPEQIAAFADGQLDEAERNAVEAAIAADSALARQVAAHRALRERLSEHFAPVAAQPVPDRLSSLLRPSSAEVVDLAQARSRRKGLPRWTWIAGPALAASLALVVTLDRGDAGYVPAEIAPVLETRLVAQQSQDAPVRVLLSFQDASGAYCRAFSGQAASGIACRDARGWKLRGDGAATENGDASRYRQAGSAADIMAQAQALSAGPALDDDGERAARNRGWRASGR